VRKPSKRELNLLFLFLGSIFLMANLACVSKLLRAKSDLESKLTAFRNERREANSWLAEKDTWHQRKEWLDKTQPKLQTAGEADAALLDTLQRSASRHDITIVEKGFAEPASLPFAQEIAVNMKVSGSLESMVRWLSEIQQPGNFQAIPSLSMKSDNDPSKVVCELTVARWYAVK
jgi:hypothetical protein